MANPTRGIKEELYALAEKLPADATWKDVACEAYVRLEVEAGLTEARDGKFAGENEVTDAFAKWGVQR
jgi:predicted transcriptional regulator